MFTLIITVCLLASDGSIQCQVPASGYYLNGDACRVDMNKAPDIVLRHLDKAGRQVASVSAQCAPLGPTPKAS
jgi:hypothetical protein